MQIIHLPGGEAGEPAVVGIGVFDGLHLGHRHLVEEVKRYAAATGLRSSVLTFDPPPPLVMADQGFKLLLTLEEKLQALDGLEIDVLCLLHFNHEMAELEPLRFVSDILTRTKVQIVVVGENFFFGRDRTGTPQLLASLGARFGFQVVVLPLLQALNGESISSTVIRRLILEGDLPRANELLGSTYSVALRETNCIIVDQGEETLPLAVYQVRDEEKLLPPPGRYQAKRVDESRITVELDTSGRLLAPDLQGHLRISFCSRL